MGFHSCMEAHEANVSDLKAAAGRSTEILVMEFLRPRDCFEIYRIRRGHLYRLIESGKVKSVSLKERGKLRGVRLVVHQSLRDWIYSHEVTGGESEGTPDASDA